MNSSGIGPVRAQWEKMRGNGVSGAMDKWDGDTAQRWQMSSSTNNAYNLCCSGMPPMHVGKPSNHR